MFRKSKIEPVEKVKIVERYLAGEIGIQQAGKELGVDHHSIRNWISIYQYDGPTGLLNQPKNKSYSVAYQISRGLIYIISLFFEIEQHHSNNSNRLKIPDYSHSARNTSFP